MPGLRVQPFQVHAEPLGGKLQQEDVLTVPVLAHWGVGTDPEFLDTTSSKIFQNRVQCTVDGL